MLMIDYNYCCYSDGNKHDCCNHQHYCVFNPNRGKLEKKLMSLIKQLNKFQKELHSIHKGDCYTETNYNELKDKIRLLKTDIKHLRAKS